MLPRALVLDPDNDDARGSMLRLLTHPPATPPPAAQSAIERLDERRTRAAGKIAGWAILAIVAVALLTAFEVAVDRLVPVLFPAALAAGVCMWSAYRRPLRGLWAWLMVLGGLGVGAASGFVGPLVVTPGLALGLVVVALYLARDDRQRLLAVLAGLLVVLVPVALELGGWLPKSYENVTGTIVIHSRLLELPDRPYPMGVLTASLITILAPAVFVWGLTKRNRDLQGRLQVVQWQLRQIAHDAPDDPAA